MCIRDRPGTSQKDIIQMEGIDGIEGEDITSKDSTGLFRCLVPVQFPCFSFDLYRDYKTATHIPVSYTHLDVYKRQVFPMDLCDGMTEFQGNLKILQALNNIAVQSP